MTKEQYKELKYSMKILCRNLKAQGYTEDDAELAMIVMRKEFDSLYSDVEYDQTS